MGPQAGPAALGYGGRKMSSEPPHMLFRRWLAATTAIAYLSAATACSPFQTWTRYSYKKLGTETKTITLPEETYLYRLVTTPQGYFLQLRRRTHCKHMVQDRVRETVHHKVKAPASLYYIILGSVVAAISVPFYVIGARASGKTRRNNILMGTLMFLVPGGALAGVGGYLKAMEGTTRTDLGITRRTVRSKKFVCKTRPVDNRKVSVGTLLGRVAIGKTDAQGSIRLSHLTLKPLVRYQFSKVTKVYLDIYLEGEDIGELDVPWGRPKAAMPLLKPQPRPRPAARPRPGQARPDSARKTPRTIPTRPRPAGTKPRSDR